jgi:hypothetical protein
LRLRKSLGIDLPSRVETIPTLLHALRIDIETDSFEMTTKCHGERQADISETDNRDFTHFILP